MTLSGAGRICAVGLAESPATTGRGRRGGWRALRVKAAGPGAGRSAASRAATSRRSRSPGSCTSEADVLLLDEPTRGIDVGSKAEIYRLIGELAAEGKAVVMVSSYLPELFGICDRLAVMTRGVLSAARPIGRMDRARR